MTGPVAAESDGSGRFVVCIHDATPAYAHETRTMLRDLAPIVGRRLAFAVVPDWCGEWPLPAHPDYCRLIRDSSEELLLHGYLHRRQRGWGAATLIAGRCDEMSGLSQHETGRLLERGQCVFTDVFGAPARGFLAPAWQRGHVRSSDLNALGLNHVLGFFSVESAAGERVPLATWTWDCGRWGWLGHIGHGVGWLSHVVHRGAPVIAIHPKDLDRGFWPKILRLTRAFVANGYQPSTVAALLDCRSRERRAHSHVNSEAREC